MCRWMSGCQAGGLRTWGTDGGGQHSELVASVALSAALSLGPDWCSASTPSVPAFEGRGPDSASPLLHEDPRWFLCAAATAATSWVGSGRRKKAAGLRAEEVFGEDACVGLLFPVWPEWYKDCGWAAHFFRTLPCSCSPLLEHCPCTPKGPAQDSLWNLRPRPEPTSERAAPPRLRSF